MNSLLQQFLNRQVFNVQHDENIDRAIELMEQHKIRHVPVLKKESVVGMVSDRDILLSVGGLSNTERYAEGRKQLGGPRLIHEIMSSPIRTLSVSASAREIIDAMLDRKIHAIPILEGARLVGLITSADLLQLFLEDRFDGHNGCGWRVARVSKYMSRDVLTLKPTEPVLTAFRSLSRLSYRHMPVTQDGRLVGIVTDRDLRRSIGLSDSDPNHELRSKSRGQYEHRVEDVMTTNVIVTEGDALLAEAAEILTANKIGALPILATEKLEGIITETDLLRAISISLRNEKAESHASH